MEHPSNDHEDHPISTRIAISHAMKRHPILRLLERQWKLRQQQDQNLPMEEKPLQNKERNPKEKDCVSHIQGSE